MTRSDEKCRGDLAWYRRRRVPVNPSTRRLWPWRPQRLQWGRQWRPATGSLVRARSSCWFARWPVASYGHPAGVADAPCWPLKFRAVEAHVFSHDGLAAWLVDHSASIPLICSTVHGNEGGEGWGGVAGGRRDEGEEEPSGGEGRAGREGLLGGERMGTVSGWRKGKGAGGGGNLVRPIQRRTNREWRDGRH